MSLLAPAKAPCRSCPYRRDVPAGIWHAREYLKLPEYDGETWEQSPAVFLCHQKDDHICAGWLACHDSDELLALRMHQAELDPSCFRLRESGPGVRLGARGRRAWATRDWRAESRGAPHD